MTKKTHYLYTTKTYTLLRLIHYYYLYTIKTYTLLRLIHY